MSGKNENISNLQKTVKNNDNNQSNDKDLINLHQFMDNYRIVKSASGGINITKPTHTSMGSYLGSFSIPDNKIFLFLKYYHFCLKEIPFFQKMHDDIHLK